MSDQPPFPAAPVEELLRLFSRAVRAHQLYLPNNPIYKGAIDAVRGAFAPIWQQTSELPLKFSETEIKWFGRPVLTETTKSSDSIPWTFFKDGVREVQFTPGFENEELVRLFDILQRVRKASPDEDDLLTLLWAADFANLRYRYVDLGAEAVPSLADGTTPPAAPTPGQIASAAREQTEETRNAIVNLQDFDATLIFLDEKELQYLRGEVEREYTSNLRQNVVGILLDIYEAQSSVEVRKEISELLEALMLLLLAGGQLRDVAYLFTETRAVLQRLTDLSPQQAASLRALPDRLSAPGPLSQLLQALDEAADLPAQTDLADLFSQLQPAALGTIFAWLPKVQNARLRPLVEHAADRLASSATAELVKLILSEDLGVAMEAARRSGAMKASAAVVSLAKLLGHSDVAVRQAAVQALSDIGSPGALQVLERSVDDTDRDIRVTVARTLAAKSYRAALPRLDGKVKGKGIRSADLTEKMAVFEAYGALCGDGGIEFLDGILNPRGMFGKREDPELRACAAVALGRINSARARQSLQQAAQEKDVVIRNAVNRALRASAS